ncbi:MAG: DNA repair protein RecO [Phycisphaerales bacterium]|nr:DNA repair protein RecO [Phycisphaerales bacterium]MCB9862806.1 DNA repair protein RecO [Phycisphaerales bacterium]
MALVKDSAIVLRRLDFSETSQVLAVFTRAHGQQRVIAKGVKRSTKTRTGIGIDLLEKGDIVFSARPGKEDRLATLTEWRQRDGYRHLRDDLARMYAAEYAADVTVQLTEAHDPHPGLFDTLDAFLRGLEKLPPADALSTYLWRMLREIGLRPQMDACVSCGRETTDDELLFFSSHQGGAVCRDCEPSVVEKRRLSRETALLLSHANEAVSGRAFPLLDYHLREMMGRPSKLSALVRRAFGVRHRA